MQQRRSALPVRGFTLIEVLVVIAIIGLLAGLVGPQVVKHFGEAKSKSARLQVEQLSAALDLYRLDIGRYPSTNEGLEALIRAPTDARSWNGPYLRKKKIPVDPWSNPYHYQAPGEHGSFDLYSLGADGKDGGDGDDADVVNWE